jgi:hypothetical protein
MALGGRGVNKVLRCAAKALEKMGIIGIDDRAAPCQVWKYSD